MLAGASDLRAIFLWGRRLTPEALHAFEIESGKLSHKRTLITIEQDRPDVARRRSQWIKYQDRVDPSRLVLIDEIWTKTNMTSLYAWAPIGQRLFGKAPFGNWNTSTLIAALRSDRIEAPWPIDGPIKDEKFLLYLEEVLIPTLKPGDLVVLDNISSHKDKAVRKAIRAAGAKLVFLPKSSLDLNPIEPFFAKLKHFLRKADQGRATPSAM